MRRLKQHFCTVPHLSCGFIFMHIYYICTYFISGLSKETGFMPVVQRVHEVICYFHVQKGVYKDDIIPMSNAITPVN